MEIIELNTRAEDKRVELDHAEQAIERSAKRAFEEWGAQLKHIRDNRLYLVYSPSCTWEQYLQDRWEMSKRRGNQLIDAYTMLKKMEEFFPKGEKNCPLPSRESHISALSALSETSQQADVWQRTLENNSGGITAGIIKAEVSRYQAELEKNWYLLSQWEGLPADEQSHLLRQPPNTDKKFNLQDGDSIEWARLSWNPVTGCRHDCDYCYARDIANRFFAQGFEPTIIPERLHAPSNTKQKDLSNFDDPVDRLGWKNVFVCSMADLFGKWVPEEWIRAVLGVMAENPQWNYLILTKFPIRMSQFEYPDNVWLGTSVDQQGMVARAEKAFQRLRDSGFGGVTWLSCEPMMERLTFEYLGLFDWLVMGGSSRSAKTPEYKPPFDDTVHLYQQAKVLGLPVYFKTNLGIEDECRVREYPQ